MGRLTGTTARTAAVCGAAVLALAGFASGGTGDPATPETAAHTTLLALNTGEAEEGQLAVQMAAHARVRDFAQMMVNQHGGAVSRLQLSMMRVGLMGNDLAMADYNRGSNSQGVDQRGHPIPENNSGSPNGSTGGSAAGTDLNRDPGNGQPIVANNGAANGMPVGSGGMVTTPPNLSTGNTTAQSAQGTTAASLGSNGQMLDRNGKPIPENNSGHNTGTVGSGQSVFSADAPQPASRGGDHPGGRPATEQELAATSVGSGRMTAQPSSTRVMAWNDPRLHDMLMASSYGRPIVEDHMRAMARLQSVRAAAFDRAYMDRQIAAHRYALRAIDNLLPSLRAGASAETVAMTEQMRATVVQHLAMAQQIRASLR
ncbi:MAG: DUF4142 domain-containing protein [Gemmatimonadetes bacterium]|nr:DUF4142 domain-containing protein [Gemmatimonadota bacterium]